MTFTCLTSIYFIFSFPMRTSIHHLCPTDQGEEENYLSTKSAKKAPPTTPRKQICKEKYKVGLLGASLIIYPVAQRRTLRHLVPTSHRQNESLLEPTLPHSRRAALKLTGLVLL
jgi:hypothetical protein